MKIFSLANDIVLLVKASAEVQSLDIIDTAIAIENAEHIIDELPTIVAELFRKNHPVLAANLQGPFPDEITLEMYRVIKAISEGEYGQCDS